MVVFVQFSIQGEGGTGNIALWGETYPVVIVNCNALFFHPSINSPNHLPMPAPVLYLMMY